VSTGEVFTIDKLGCEHYKTSHTGPGLFIFVVLTFTVLLAKQMLMTQLKAVVKEGRTVIVIIVDGRPDWTPASLLNLFFRDAGLDMLVVCSYAARYSAN